MPKKALEAFGSYLKGLREQNGLLQRMAASALKVSTALVAQYEGGRIVDPDPELLSRMAKLYKVDHLAVVLELVREKYRGKCWVDLAPRSDHEETELFGSKQEVYLWGALRAILKRPEEPSRLAFGDLVRSRQDLLESGEILDVQAMAVWQKTFQELDEFWVIAPNPLDANDETIDAAVAEAINQRKTRYVYFFYADEGPGRLAYIRNAIDKKLRIRGGKPIAVKKHIVAFKIPDPKPSESVSLMATYYMIANPGKNTAVGFRCILERGRSRWAIRMRPDDVKKLVEDWSVHLTEENSFDYDATS